MGFQAQALQQLLEERALARVMQPIEPLACTPEEVQVEKLRKASFLYDVLARQKTVEYRL
ncbi:hypothetical protein [Neomoorella mulderi]|uniref:Uncharacterized protein n=1 Tax=Moorella mulderi DSM 14980 TaxID=1122241 RepID=A0A151AZA4_9FIRM|nr:hypothetical protein [Moorella mulderi]KYH32984.1 hypothetical protein MOMUL_07620 [Moorella mulderi DSM 14980]